MLTKKELKDLDYLSNQKIILDHEIKQLNPKLKKTLKKKIKEKNKKIKKKLTHKLKKLKKPNKDKKRIRAGNRIQYKGQRKSNNAGKIAAAAVGTGLLTAGAITAAVLLGDDSELPDEGQDEGQDIDCVGDWSDCDASCQKTFNVTVEAEGGGEDCEVPDGTTQQCETGVMGVAECCELGTPPDSDCDGMTDELESASYFGYYDTDNYGGDTSGNDNEWDPDRDNDGIMDVQEGFCGNGGPDGDLSSFINQVLDANGEEGDFSCQDHFPFHPMYTPPGGQPIDLTTITDEQRQELPDILQEQNFDNSEENLASTSVVYHDCGDVGPDDPCWSSVESDKRYQALSGSGWNSAVQIPPTNGP